jgi:NAD(P)-dependent dehydrogenase (short-subunit alcohol dehydrogenase family)
MPGRSRREKLHQTYHKGKQQMDKSVAVVTGGTRGIGLGIAERLVHRDFSLAITYINDEKSAEKAHQHLDRLKKED